VRKEDCVDIVKTAVARKPCLRRDQFFGDTRPKHYRSRQRLPLHDVLHGERGRDVHGLTGIMALAMARRALDDRLPPGYARHLRGFRNAVDVRTERNDRLAVSPRRPPRRRYSGHASFDREAVFLEDSGEIPLRFEFLEAELGKGKKAVDDFLCQPGHSVDFSGGFGLVTRQNRGRLRIGLLFGGTHDTDGQRCTGNDYENS
jgi:hypothetical protein